MPFTLIANGHSKSPKTPADIAQICNFIKLSNSDIFVADLNFEAKNKPEDFDKVQTFINTMSAYSIPSIGGKTSDDKVTLAGDVSTTRKVRGGETIQNNKMGVESQSRKSYILWKKNVYDVKESGCFPDLNDLNSMKWPADHQFLWSVAIDKKTGNRVLTATFNKVKNWKYNEWLQEGQMDSFFKNSAYLPNKDDPSSHYFYEMMYCVYPKMKDVTFNSWYDFIKTYNQDNEFGMHDNSFVSEWSKPDDRMWSKTSYPSIVYDENENPVYNCWSWKKFSQFLKKDPNNTDMYTVKDFETWSTLWFAFTGLTTPIEGGGTYFVDPDDEDNTNHPWFNIKDNGINYGCRLFHYYMTWQRLYQLNQHPCITMNIEPFSLYTKYKRAFIGIFGSVDNNVPCGSFSNKFRPEYNNSVISQKKCTLNSRG